jgi:hypothetical protein
MRFCLAVRNKEGQLGLKIAWQTSEKRFRSVIFMTLAFRGMLSPGEIITIVQQATQKKGWIELWLITSGEPVSHWCV